MARGKCVPQARGVGPGTSRGARFQVAEVEGHWLFLLSTKSKFHRVVIPGSGDRKTCNSQKDKLLKSTRAVRPDGCSGAHSAQDDSSTQRRSWHTRYLPQSPARSHASARNMPKVHHANVSTSAKTWVLCVQEWFLSSRDRLKKYKSARGGTPVLHGSEPSWLQISPD